MIDFVFLNSRIWNYQRNLGEWKLYIELSTICGQCLEMYNVVGWGKNVELNGKIIVSEYEENHNLYIYIYIFDEIGCAEDRGCERKYVNYSSLIWLFYLLLYIDIGKLEMYCGVLIFKILCACVCVFLVFVYVCVYD